MNWHLDTNILIDCLRGSATLSMRIRKEHPNVAISAMVLGELLFGVRISKSQKLNEAAVWRIVRPVRILPFDEQCAKAYADVRASLRAMGRPTGEADMAIAATAVAHRAVMVTRNRKHFEQVPGLTIEDWTTPI